MRHKVERNAAKAEPLFAKAEKCEENGLQKEAFEYLLKAADLGHTGAQVTLGNNFSWGKGVKKSSVRAAYWYRRAYRGGDESGAFNLALDKLKAKNIRSAMFWFERARAMGSGEAALELSKIYLGKKGGRPKALHLLQLTQKMKRAEISDETKQEAERLLSKLNEPEKTSGADENEKNGDSRNWPTISVQSRSYRNQVPLCRRPERSVSEANALAPKSASGA